MVLATRPSYRLYGRSSWVTELKVHEWRPGPLSVQSPPQPEDLRGDVEGDVNALFFLVPGGVSLLVRAIWIANVTLVSVLGRVGERAAPRPRHRPWPAIRAATLEPVEALRSI